VGPLPDGELVVTTGLDFSCAFMPDGDAYCWGDNEDLQLGFSKDIASEVDAPNTPVAGSHTFRQLALGRFHTCGVSTGADPQVYCWGGNRHAQLGNGGASDGTSEPLRVRF
jgi:alpha-tubulin suppressor-like RCC1 family protein